MCIRDSVCPAPKGKALIMKPFDEVEHQSVNWDYAMESVKNKADLVDKSANIKNSQFAQPYLEFSGACACLLYTS